MYVCISYNQPVGKQMLFVSLQTANCKSAISWAHSANWKFRKFHWYPSPQIASPQICKEKSRVFPIFYTCARLFRTMKCYITQNCSKSQNPPWNLNEAICGRSKNQKKILSPNLQICDLRNLFKDCPPFLMVHMWIHLTDVHMSHIHIYMQHWWRGTPVYRRNFITDSVAEGSQWSPGGSGPGANPQHHAEMTVCPYL